MWNSWYRNEGQSLEMYIVELYVLITAKDRLNSSDILW